MNQELMYAYMAGFVDADGSISIKTESQDRPYVPFITIYNCNYEVIELFYREWGNGKQRYRKSKTHKNWRPCYEFSLTKRRAAEVIAKLYPYLHIKKRQATLVLRLSRLRAKYRGGVRRWNPELNAKCERVYSKIKDKCKSLNKRGT